MPNWCYTNIHFVNEDKNEIEKLYKFIETWTSKNAKENGFGLTWLGNVVLNSGIETVKTKLDTDVIFRGSISNYSINEEQLVVVTKTACSPILQMWVKIIEKYSPKTKIFYTAEELGCDLLYTNDLDIYGKYYLDSWDCSIETVDCIEEEDLILVLQKYFDSEEKEISNLIDLLYYMSEPTIAVHQWEYANINEWD